MTKPVLPEAIERVFVLMDLAIDGRDLADVNVALSEDATASEEEVKQLLGHAIGLLAGVSRDHYPGGVAALKSDLRRKFGIT